MCTFGLARVITLDEVLRHSVENGSNSCIYSIALLQATSAQTTSLVAAAEAARSSLEISELAQKAQDISVKRALWALQTIKVAAKAEEVAVNAIQTMFM